MLHIETITLTCDPTDKIGQVDHSILSVIAGMGGDENPLFRFFTTREARVLREVSNEFRHFVTETPWDDVRRTIFDYRDHTTDVASPLHVNVPLWRACFPNAIGVRLAGREPLTDKILMHLRGILYLDGRWETQREICERKRIAYRCPSIDEPYDCSSITDDGFQYLQGVRWLDLSGRDLRHATDAGFVHLRGIEHLFLGQTHLPQISPSGFLQLRGITTLSGCEYVNPLWRCIRYGDTDAAIAMIGTVDQMWTHADDNHCVFRAACDIKNKPLICALLMHGIRPATNAVHKKSGIRPATRLLFDMDIRSFVLNQGY